MKTQFSQMQVGKHVDPSLLLHGIAWPSHLFHAWPLPQVKCPTNFEVGGRLWLVVKAAQFFFLERKGLVRLQQKRRQKKIINRLPPGVKVRAVIPYLTRIMSSSTSSMMVDEQMVPENTVQQIELLAATEDSYGGVRVEIKNPMDSNVFGDLLRASKSHWRQKGRKGVWIKLPIEHANLVEPAIKEGFWYHHAEPDYLMLVNWIPKTAHTLPANASHRVGIGAFVINSRSEVLVVQEKSGSFKGTGVWKMPTGVVNEGEDICTAAIREVEEETGIKTEFVELLAFRQSHKSFFTKSDLFFVCLLQPLSSEIQMQDEEIEAAQWMPVEEYAGQPFVKKNPIFDSVANICIAKKDNKYTGFSPFSSTTSSGKTSILYFNNQDLEQPLSSGNEA